MPAMERMVRLLPHPDAPNSPSVSSPAENRACRLNPLNFFSMSTSRLMVYSERLRYLVVCPLHRLMNTMTTRENTMMTPVQNQATSLLPFIHSK